MKKTATFTFLAALLFLGGTPAYSQTVPAQVLPSQQQNTVAELTKELPMLRKGDSGGAVRLLQNILISQRLLDPSSRTTIFDDKTEQAVRKFQQQYNLSVDGVVGSRTWSMLGGVLWD